TPMSARSPTDLRIVPPSFVPIAACTYANRGDALASPESSHAAQSPHRVYGATRESTSRNRRPRNEKGRPLRAGPRHVDCLSQLGHLDVDAGLADVAAALVLVAVVHHHLQPVDVPGLEPERIRVPRDLGAVALRTDRRRRVGTVAEVPVVLRRIGSG